MTKTGAARIVSLGDTRHMQVEFRHRGITTNLNGGCNAFKQDCILICCPDQACFHSTYDFVRDKQLPGAALHPLLVPGGVSGFHQRAALSHAAAYLVYRDQLMKALRQYESATVVALCHADCPTASAQGLLPCKRRLFAEATTGFAFLEACLEQRNKLLPLLHYSIGSRPVHEALNVLSLNEQLEEIA